MFTAVFTECGVSVLLVNEQRTTQTCNEICHELVSSCGLLWTWGKWIMISNDQMNNLTDKWNSPVITVTKYSSMPIINDQRLPCTVSTLCNINKEHFKWNSSCYCCDAKYSRLRRQPSIVPTWDATLNDPRLQCAVITLYSVNNELLLSSQVRPVSMVKVSILCQWYERNDLPILSIT